MKLPKFSQSQLTTICLFTSAIALLVATFGYFHKIRNIEGFSVAGSSPWSLDTDRNGDASLTYKGVSRLLIPKDNQVNDLNKYATKEDIFKSATSGLPKKVIVMWHGTAPPPGWALCDGTNGTPDLREKFIFGWGSQEGVGIKGGGAANKPYYMRDTGVEQLGGSDIYRKMPYYRMAFIQKL